MIPFTFRASPDNKRVAYGVDIGNKWFVVVDGKEEKKYDSIVALGGGRIVFDSPDSLHYFALNNEKLYLIYEKIK